MCVLYNKRDIYDQLTLDLENEDGTFTNQNLCDYIEIGEFLKSMYSPGNLNLIQLNVRGLLSKQPKINELIDNIEMSLEIHALLLCETRLTPDTHKLLKINNFSYTSTERNGKKGGRVAFLIRKIYCLEKGKT